MQESHLWQITDVELLPSQGARRTIKDHGLRPHRPNHGHVMLSQRIGFGCHSGRNEWIATTTLGRAHNGEIEPGGGHDPCKGLSDGLGGWGEGGDATDKIDHLGLFPLIEVVRRVSHIQ